MNQSLINTVSEELIITVAEIYPLLVMRLEAAQLCLETVTHGQIQQEQGLTLLYLEAYFAAPEELGI